MRLCFIGSGMEDANERLTGIEIGAVAEVLRTSYDTLVFGGSSDGFMGSFASAFADRGGRLMAVVPEWLEELGLVHTRAEVTMVSTLAERKHVMFEAVDAVLCYPGGIGTWDELFDLLARRSIDQQVHALPPCPPIYLYDWEQFYAPLLLQLEVALEAGLVHPEAVAMLHAFASAEGLTSILREVQTGSIVRPVPCGSSTPQLQASKGRA